MKRKVRDIITIILFCSTLFANAQITKSEADAIVLNTIVNDTTKVVYAMSESISSNISVYTANGVELINPYNESYVYFIDDCPVANWAHACRYCFVNIVNGTYTINSQMFYPNNYEEFSRVGQISYRNRRQWPYTNYTIPQKASPNGNLYAVLIGGDKGNHAPIKTWYNLSCVYTSLVNKYGYKERSVEGEKSNLLVIAPDDVKNSVYSLYPNNYYFWDLNQSNYYQYEDDFVDLSYSKNNIQLLFDNLSGQNTTIDSIPELTEKDQLFVFLCGHGDTINGNSFLFIYYDINNPIRLYDYELANWVRNIKCSQITFLIDCCHSGGFIDNLMNDTYAFCKNRAVFTSTDYNHISSVEHHITGNGCNHDGWQRVDEFVYYWTAAILGYYPILETHNDWITGPWYQYDNTAIGQFLWGEFCTFVEGNGYSHVGYDVNPDTNNDGIVTMDEAFVFTNNIDSFSPVGYYHPYMGFVDGTEYPQSSYESTFTKELVTLNGYRGTISNNASTGTGHNYTLSGNISVDENSTLTINNNTMIDGIQNMITNYGVIQTGANISNADFYNVRLINRGGTVSLSNCVFDTCGIVETIDGPFSITNSTFNETSLLARIDEMPREPYNVVITNDTFNVSSNIAAIELKKIPQCNVSGNVITSGGNGIYLNRLSGAYTSYLINNNTISNCGGSGILSYASNGSLYGNVITGNDVDGLQSLNLSGLYVTGNNMAFSRYETQRFTNNDRYQVHASNNSYPVNFHYNWLCGNGPSSDYILFYESNYPQGNHPKMFDVTYNCWYPLSDSNIPGHLRSSGNTAFSYLPTWSANGSLNTPDRSGSMFDLANELVETGDYDRARDLYKRLIEDSPESIEANAAMKALFSLEVESDGDFTALKDYYRSFISDDNLGGLADNLANRCDVKIGNYTDAIEWYEDKIVNPNTLFSERIFAEIDLGDLYLMMNENGHRGICGKMTEYVPASTEAHAVRTEYLLSLLPGKSENNVISNDNMYESSFVDDVTCYPNPVNETMHILYTLKSETDVRISIFSVLGEEVHNVKLGKQISGNHNFLYDCSDIQNGVYYCVISTDNGVNVISFIVNH